MRLLPFILLLLISSIVSFKGYAQPYYFRHYQVENGLSNSTVFCCAQDKSGFVWFGTKDGLNRFDGYHFKLFTTPMDERSMYPDFIFCLYPAADGTLWAGSQKGLFRFDARREKLVRFFDNVTDVSSIEMDANGQLWFISRMNVCCYNFSSNHLKVFPADRFFYATSLCSMPDGSMWFSSDNGYLHQFLPANDAFAHYNVFAKSPRPASYWIQKIKPAGKGSIYVGTTSQGLKQFDVSTAEYKDVLTYNPDRTTVFVRDIMENTANEFWFATESGIFILDRTSNTFINLRKKFLDPYSLSDNAVYSLCRDREGNIWAGTYFGGVNNYPRRIAGFQKYFPDNSGAAISGSDVREICEDSYGHLWIGTEDAGLNKLDKQTGAITHFEPSADSSSIAYTNIHGLLVSGNQLWIGTFEHGLDVMNILTGKVVRHYTAGPGKYDLKSNFTLCLLQMSAGDIYLGTSNGLYRYRKQTDNFEQPKGVPEHIFVASLIEDHQHRLWLGTHSNGAFWYDPRSGESGHLSNDPADTNSLSNNDINAVFEDSEHNIWFSTEGGGLCRLDSQRRHITRFNTKDGLPGNFIFKTLEDNLHNLWVTTSRGLVNFNPKRHSVQVYTRANGLLNDQFNYHSGYKDSAGTLYFGSVKGMISFNPVHFAHSIYQPPVYITGFQVHNRELEVRQDSSLLHRSILSTREITLPYDRSSFSIDFAALSFTSPEMTEYNFIMSGLDREWTHLNTNRKVYFTNLSPGNYTFKLTAQINGRFSSKAQDLVIHITPPFWATYYAWMIYLAVFAALCYYLIRTYHNRIVSIKERELYEAKIDFFTNIAHEIRTPLTLIKGPVENLLERKDELPEIRDDVNTLERNTNRLVTLVTQILDFRQTEKKGFSIDFTRVDIGSILQEEFENFVPLAKKKNMQFRLDLPAEPVMGMADEEALHKIFSNMLSNLIKYAAGSARVRLYTTVTEPASFIVETVNDGPLIPIPLQEKIFEPFYRLRETMKQKGTGIGLALARSLAELHNGILYLKDNKDGLNTFVLQMPMRPPATSTIGKKSKITVQIK